MKKVFASTLVLWAFLAGVVMAAVASPNSGGPAAHVHLAGVQMDGPPVFEGSNFGITSQSTATYVAHGFVPIDSGVTYAYDLAGSNLSIHRTNVSGNPWMEAAINLPNGALIEAVEARFCDSSATEAFASFFSIEDKTTPNLTQPDLVSSTPGEAPGCINRTFVFGIPLQVDNTNNAYSIEVYLGAATDATIAFSQFRVFYQLQVSPAPGVATFSDVPTSDGAFQFIEAFVASGATVGCDIGPPRRYCPDDIVTRRQMAVFFAKALGLHFPD